MTTMGGLVSATRRMAYGALTDQLNFLAAPAGVSATSLVMSMDVSGIVPGSVLSSGLNVYYVKGVDAATKTVLVHPGHDDSPSVSLSSGDVVRVRPRVTDWLLFGFVNDIVRSLSSPVHGLYRLGTWTDDTDTVWGTYEVPVEARSMTNLIRAQVLYYGTSDVWVDIPANMIDWQPERDTVRIKQYLPAGTEIKFDYKAPFLPAVDLSDDAVDDMGLAESMMDIPPLGATARLLRGTESRRAQPTSQGDSRRAEEVQAGSNSAAAREFDREFRQRVADEQIRLVNRNPYVRVFP